MIYVLAGNYQQFQNFMQEFHLREDFGTRCSPNEGCRIGQVRYLSQPYDRNLQGDRNALVLTWGTWYERQDAQEVEAFCKAVDIPLVQIPDLKRQRAYREHPEMFRRW